MTLSGNLARIEARGLILTAQVADLSPVPLAFAWVQSDTVPLLLGQVNFFLAFDVCFHRSRAEFTLALRA